MLAVAPPGRQRVPGWRRTRLTGLEGRGMGRCAMGTKVSEAGFEPAASCSRSRRAAKLRYSKFGHFVVCRAVELNCQQPGHGPIGRHRPGDGRHP